MEQIIFNLSSEFSSGIVKENFIPVYLYDTVTSTNTKTWELISKNISPPFIVIGKQQTAGKGQRGNIWRSSLGGLYLSMALNLNSSIESLNHITLWSICGVVNGLKTLNIPVKIKWLNDLMLEDKKLGGILCETKIEKNIIKNIIIGVGINYQNSYPENAISLNTYFQNYNYYPINNLIDLAKVISIELLKSYQQYLELGIENIVNSYNQFMYNRHEKVLLENNLRGEILGINHQGNLQIKLLSTNASTKINLSFENYRISYHKSIDNLYIVTEISP
ncbi:biotin--[acetyl-CoA-carboxylase] ligase [Geminocystis sp. CENA526]|uniref:biotin--[acetyl-CoA-carboxylase] ligase n=1 Tax=Geminocystis sp. CENA526 TaxID=1355871 RepID=UPI003D6F1622